MIRVVFDANTLVSAIPAASGTLATLVDLWRADAFQVVVSPHIVEEVTRSWAKPYWRQHLSPAQKDRALRLLQRKAELTTITVRADGIATHPEDDLVLATALSGRADYLITGDGPFRRKVDRFQGVVLLSAREFLHVLEREQRD